MMGAASLVIAHATPSKILIRDSNGEDELGGESMKYREVGERTAEITEERRNGKVTRHESRSNTANDSGRGSKREKKGAGHLQEKPRIRYRLESKPTTTAPAQGGGEWQ